MYGYLEAEGFLYAIRLSTSRVLQESIVHLLTRPVGRLSNHVWRYSASFSYQAESWDRKRDVVVAKVEWHPGELCPRVGCIVTNSSRPTERVEWFYNQRGKADQCIAIKTRSNVGRGKDGQEKATGEACLDGEKNDRMTFQARADLHNLAVRPLRRENNSKCGRKRV